jgi:heterodisulfide reductase subunit C
MLLLRCSQVREVISSHERLSECNTCDDRCVSGLVIVCLISAIRAVNDRFTMETVYPLVPRQSKTASRAIRDSDSDSDDDTVDPHLVFVNSTAELTPETIQTMIDYNSDDEHPENVPFSITEAKCAWNTLPIVPPLVPPVSQVFA